MGGEDNGEVRREDQDKINAFSRLHQREMALEDMLKTKAVSAQERFQSVICMQRTDDDRRRTKRI